MDLHQFTGSPKLLFLLFVSLITAPAAAAQSPQVLVENTRSDLGGRNAISGTVLLPAGVQPKTRIRVRLSTPGAEVSTSTDESGKFYISGLKAGNYTLYIEPDGDLEPDIQEIEISDPSSVPSGQVFTVTVRLRRAAGTEARPGTVNADLAGIPKRALEYFRKGLERSSKNDDKGAVELLLKAVAEHSDFMLAHSELGVLYQKLNELEKADQHLQQALKIKPDAYEPLANRGIVLVRLKRYAEAEPVLRAALKIKETAPIVHFYLGRSLLGQKRPDDAERPFRTAYEQGGKEMAEARRALATIYLDRGENRKAMEEIEAYLAEAPAPADEKTPSGNHCPN